MVRIELRRDLLWVERCVCKMALFVFNLPFFLWRGHFIKPYILLWRSTIELQEMTSFPIWKNLPFICATLFQRPAYQSEWPAQEKSLKWIEPFLGWQAPSGTTSLLYPKLCGDLLPQVTFDLEQEQVGIRTHCPWVEIASSSLSHGTSVKIRCQTMPAHAWCELSLQFFLIASVFYDWETYCNQGTNLEPKFINL